MNNQSLSGFIRSVADLLRGDYKQLHRRQSQHWAGCCRNPRTYLDRYLSHSALLQSPDKSLKYLVPAKGLEPLIPLITNQLACILSVNMRLGRGQAQSLMSS